MLWPWGWMVRRRSIQKSSLLSSKALVSALVRFLSLICSINMNLACLSKSWPGSLKCWSNGHPFVLWTSDLCPLKRWWAGGSLLPTYWLFRQRMQWARYNVFRLLQLRWCLIWNISLVCWLLNVLLEVIIRQHLFFVWLKQAAQPVDFGVFLLFGMIFFPWETCTWPMRFLRFLFRR